MSFRRSLGARLEIQLNTRNQTYRFEAQRGEPLLYAAIRQGLELPYGCTTGTCGTCRVKRIAGSIANAWVDAPGMKGVDPATREFLMCQCSALDDLVVEAKSYVFRCDPGACAPRHMNGTLRTRGFVARDVMEFSIELGAKISFEAGQFMALGIPGVPGRRVYSMTNFERGTRRLDFVVKRKPEGAFSTRLFTQSCDGLSVEAFGPLGRATFSPSAGRDLLVIAGGSGIAGMMSILARAVEEGYFERYSGNVYFGVRTWADAFYLERLSRMAQAAGDRLKITVALSDENVPDAASRTLPRLAFAQGFVHQAAAQGMNGKYANVRAYVAGPPPAVDASLRYLIRDAKMAATEIRYDKFE